jgi:hypothetical protein
MKSFHVNILYDIVWKLNWFHFFYSMTVCHFECDGAISDWTLYRRGKHWMYLEGSHIKNLYENSSLNAKNNVCLYKNACKGSKKRKRAVMRNELRITQVVGRNSKQHQWANKYILLYDWFLIFLVMNIIRVVRYWEKCDDYNVIHIFFLMRGEL